MFYGPAVAGVVVLKGAQPHMERTYRIPGDSWLSLLSCAAAIEFVSNTVTPSWCHPELDGGSPNRHGLPVYYLFLGEILDGSSQNSDATTLEKLLMPGYADVNKCPFCFLPHAAACQNKN